MRVRTFRTLLVVAAICALLAPAFAGVKKYQVTGKVLEVTDDMIAVEKGKDRWEIERTKDTKIDGDLKVGEKVTIEYTMSATSVEVKPDKDSGAAGKPTTKPSKPAKPAE